MKPYDPQKAAQVWQRVRAQQPEAPQTPRDLNLSALIMEELSMAAAYQQLARQLNARQSAALQRLSREELAHAACLKGICILVTGEAPAVQTPATEKDALLLALRKCCGREMRSLRDYESRVSDPEYGPVFRRLAEQEWEHCRTLLELIGSLPPSQGR